MTEIANLTSAQISKIAKLIKEKETLQAKIDKIDAELAATGAGTAPAKRRGRKPGPKKATAAKGTRKRGAVKEKILDLLKKSGSEGIGVQEIADKIKLPARNVHSWFQTTGKKLPGITKVGRAKYTLK